MNSAKTKAELQQHKTKLANSYSELLKEFASSDLRHVGNYTLGKLVGKGSFGKVYLARHNLTNSKVVLKSSKKDDANLAREIHHHRQFIHPHIARLYEVVVTETLVWLVLEYCPGDELYNYLLRTGPLPVETVQKIFTQLAGAVAYIHSKSCVHRDLKLENVLLDKNENVKLCDFGFTREYEGKSSYLQTFCGTVCYSAPEMLKGEKYAGEKVDVWSLGIILFALLKGELPFDEDDDQLTKAKILRDDPVYPDTFPDPAKTLLSKLLSKRPLHRPTLAEILADPFLIDHAPHQQATLKLSQPSPFTTPLEKNTLERMRSVGVDLDKVIESVLAQRCDTFAGWWALLLEKEQKKEIRRERRRKEKEAEMKLLRRLSAASSRLDRIALENVVEESSKQNASEIVRNRSLSRGRSQRRSTPQILVTDLPRLPEGTAVDTPGSATPPPPPVDKDSIRSRSGSRPPIPPKERKRRSSHLQLVTNSSDVVAVSNGINKRRRSKRRDNHFLHSLAAIKHWFIENTKIPKSPRKQLSQTATDSATQTRPSTAKVNGHNRDVSGASAQTRSSYGVALTPIASNMTGPQGMRLETARVRPRTSISPITPSRAQYRHSSLGLKGRKSTSSSVSSVRSIQRHSKASSISSNSIDTINSPSRSTARSPHPSIKVLPTTPTIGSFPSNGRFVRDSRNEAFTFPQNAFQEDVINGQSSNVMFARRKKSPFKGPSLNPSLAIGNVGQGHSSPLLRPQSSSAGHLNLGLLDTGGRRTGKAKQRKSQIIEEEDEDEDEDEVIEEVEDFTPIDLRRGESVHSIVIWDDPPDEEEEEENDDVPELPTARGHGGPITAAQLRELNERVEREKAAMDARGSNGSL